MEAVDEDEAKSIASDWIKRSVLAQVANQQISDRHFHNRVDDSVSCTLSCDNNDTELVELASDESSDEATRFTSNHTSQRPFVLSETSRVSIESSAIASPRIDLDLLRTKRLQHFEGVSQSFPLNGEISKTNDVVPSERLSCLSLLSDRPEQPDGMLRVFQKLTLDSNLSSDYRPTLDSSLSSDCKPTLDSSLSSDYRPTLDSSLSSDYRPTLDSSLSSDYRPTLLDSSLSSDYKPTLDSNLSSDYRPTLDSSLSSDYKPTLDCDCKLGDNSWTTLRQEDDEDQLRLELWGLRGAVETGQLDIQSYLGSYPKHKPKTTVDKKSKLTSRKSHTVSYNMSSRLDMNDNIAKSDHNTNSTAFPKVKHDKCLEQSTELFTMWSQGSPRSKKSNNLYNNKSKHLNDHGMPNNSSSIPPLPYPQIQGALYNGFETSDSEGSVHSVNMVHNTKLLVKSLESGKTSRTGKGKQKILNELTEYLDSDRKEKKSKHGVKNSSSTTISPSDFQNSSVCSVEQESCDDTEDCPTHDTSPGNYQPCHNEATMSLSIKTTVGSVAKSDAMIVRENGPLCSENMQSPPKRMAKVCPKCSEINSQAANWCIECGSALVKTKPTFLSHDQQASYEQQCRETQTLIAKALNPTKKVLNGVDSTRVNGNKSLEEDIASLSKVVNSTTELKNESYNCNQLSDYKRRWHKSSLAWSTFEQRELSKPSSIKKPKRKETMLLADTDVRKSSSSCDFTGFNAESENRNGHKGSRRRTTSVTPLPDDVQVVPSKGRPCSATVHSNSRHGHKGYGKRPGSAQVRTSNRSRNENCDYGTPSCRTEHEEKQILYSHDDHSKSPTKKPSSVVPPLNLNDIDSYDRILTLIRSQHEPTPYLYLPDEILLKIFTSLSHRDLVACTLVCWQFYRIAMDETLWRAIVLRKKEIKCDDWLKDIGKRRPSSLTISHCHGNCVSADGLRTMFRSCSDTLEEVDFSGCSGGELIGESILLHISARCINVVSVDVSWTNVSDNGVQALVENVTRLECLCLNGCQAITDKSLKCVSDKHGESLHIFEVFGCFNITPVGIQMLGRQCNHLHTLNLGQCYKMTDAALGALVSHLPELENLDLRGCKQARDSAVMMIAHHCPLLTCLVLANCPLITDVALAEIATNLPLIKSLDICGCANVSDAGVRALARSCNKMEHLDLSSTGNAVTHKSVTCLANYCSRTLTTLKLSFCADITDQTIMQLAKHCNKLSILHLYGCKRVRNLDGLKAANPLLAVER